MKIFDKFESVAQRSRELYQQDDGAYFDTSIEEIISPTEAIIKGRRCILLGTNNYLGLTMDSRCMEAGCQAIQSYGTGTTGSRMANGNYTSHRDLEGELAEFYGCPEAIVFSTGYLAVYGIISTLAGPGDSLLLDGDCHASIYDGSSMSGAKVFRFRHNNPVDLEKRIRRQLGKSGSILICIEGIYSMLGDKALIKDIVEIKKRHGAYLIIDEAHSLGVLGQTGQGLAEEADLQEEVDFIIGTFSKSLGTMGGFCTSRHPELELLRYSSRAYIFTASPSPATIASTRQALKIIRSEPELRRHIWQNSHILYSRLQDMGLSLGPEPSPVIAILLSTSQQALKVWNGLLERGVYVNVVFPPATPDRRPLLRCSVNACHSKEQLDQVCCAFEDLRDLVLTN